MSKKGMDRREFLKSSTAGLGAFLFVPPANKGPKNRFWLKGGILANSRPGFSERPGCGFRLSPWGS